MEKMEGKEKRREENAEVYRKIKQTCVL